jgi:hypothetical protein
MRREVRERANSCCEYCLLAEDDAYFPHEADHIISIKHRGRSVPENLAWSCFDCNRFKGSDIASLDTISGELVPLFNPRVESWDDHFQLDAGSIRSLTSIGRATAALLTFNLPQRIEIRASLTQADRYPRRF